MQHVNIRAQPSRAVSLRGLIGTRTEPRPADRLLAGIDAGIVNTFSLTYISIRDGTTAG